MHTFPRLLATLAFVSFSAALLRAEIVRCDLTISEIDFTPSHLPPSGHRALAINRTLPGPTLRFREGDTARITVHNALATEDTSLHWHGLLVPNAMDGVPYLTTPPIPPGGTQVFEFPLRHGGTYWYHSHSGLQEQRGVYGSIVVEPRDGDPLRVDRDHVVVLSDWIDESPSEVMRDLMRGSEWYGIKKGTAQSLSGAYRAGKLSEWFSREKARMPPMDISDVAYDAFLINGQATSKLPAKPGERIRLRIINAGASSYFYLHAAGAPLTVIAADGNEVEPFEIDRLLIGIAETYDLLYTVPPTGNWELRATAQDNSGSASLLIGDQQAHLQAATPIASPDLYSMDEMLIGALAEDIEETAAMPRPPAPYLQLRARVDDTRVTPELGAGSREIELRLTGSMRRYRWSIDNKTLAEQSTIPVKRGEVLRLTLINDTMMHHPMHLHGHFFRLLDDPKNPDHKSPLKHTVDVPPMGKRTLEFVANEEGDWFFHCHLLYHMDAGMARILSYRAAEDPSHQPAFDPALDNPWFFFAGGMALHNMSMGKAMAMSGDNDLFTMWDISYGDHNSYEIDLGLTHHLDDNLAAHLGYRFTDIHHTEDRAFAGLQYRLPYLVESRADLDSEGDLRLSLGKEFPITPRLTLGGEAEYDTHTDWEFQADLSYRLSKPISLTTMFHSDHGWGFGLSLQF